MPLSAYVVLECYAELVVPFSVVKYYITSPLLNGTKLRVAQSATGTITIETDSLAADESDRIYPSKLVCCLLLTFTIYTDTLTTSSSWALTLTLTRPTDPSTNQTRLTNHNHINDRHATRLTTATATATATPIDSGGASGSINF